MPPLHETPPPAPERAMRTRAALAGVVAGVVAAASPAAAAPTDPAAALADALPRLVFELGTLAGDGWVTRDVDATLTLLPDDTLGATATAAALELPAPVGTLTGLRVACDRLLLSMTRLRCTSAVVSAADVAARGALELRGELEYRRREGRLTFRLVPTALPGGSGTLTVAGAAHRDGWSLEVQSQALPLAAWAGAAARAGAAAAPAEGDAPPARTLDGSLDLHLTLEGRGTSATGAFEARLEALATSNASGTSAAEGVALTLDGSLALDGAALHFDGRARADTGEVYQEPVYADLAEHPLTLHATGTADTRSVSLATFRIDQPEVMAGEGSARFARDGTGWTLQQAALTLDPLTLPGAYAVLLQPFLANTDLDDLETTGTLDARLAFADDALTTAEVELREVFADDRSGRLALYGLDGRVTRTADGRITPRSLRWTGGFVYGIAFGAADASFEAREDGGWKLAQPMRLPVLDGALDVEHFEVAAPNTPDGDAGARGPSIAFDAELRPVGMRALARALDWPPLSGTLSGRIPSVTYENGEISIAGQLDARVFDGDVTVDGLRIREPFSDRAILQADVDLRGLDLELVTGAFSFGRITGRVDGRLHDLVLIDWRPVRFDAALYTAPGDRSRHRISQRAVDNIASLGGGGGAAAISSGFLGFFEEFGYDRLSLGCRLAGGVCRMSGLRATPDGGYLVLDGRGLPQINVVGYAREVDFDRLLAQLRAIARSEGAVVR